MEDARVRQHDFKNHLNTIYGIIQCSEDSKSVNEIREYIKHLDGSLRSIETLLHIDNKVLTAIVYNKINEAKRENINFIYKIHKLSEAFPLKSYELSEVLNNMLDNSFEAIINSEDSLREVILKISHEAPYSVIEMKNSGNKIKPENYSTIFNRSYSTKNSKGHGYGLYNVKKIVETYNGKIQLSLEEFYTVFRIELKDKELI